MASSHDSAKATNIRKWSLFALSFTTVSVSSGLVYGYPSLRRNLLTESPTTSLSEEQLGAIFTIGAWSTQGGRFLFGIARDRYGTRGTCLISLLAVVGGCVGIAVGDASNVASLGISMFCIGLGSGAQLCLQPVASLFTKSGTVLASLSGAFQISGLMFLAVLSISSNRTHAYLSNRTHAFLGLAAVVGALAIFAGFLLPVGPSFVKTVNHDVDAEKTEEMAHDVEEPAPANEEEVVVDEEQSKQQSPTSPTLQDKLRRLKKILFQKEYMALLGWFCTCIVPLQYYVGTIGFQLERMGDDSGNYTLLFSILYASVAVLAPFGGYLADRFGLGVSQGLATSLSASSFYFLASGDLTLQIPGMAFYGIGRLLVYGMYFANVGKRFGYTNYGMLAGLGLLLSAIVSLAQYPLIALAVRGKQEARYINLICGSVLLLIGIPYCFWLGVIEKKEQLHGNAAT
eukprot:CAMPEP_0183708528 /NCGR_PEP_ID=MMETSP0737-20130205/4820_1 /TAXON_ID=385413 /ORGANISM="Thalassiosira miniscula, Strain CCMP1093" /LENGTH=456 /DNA_ID=CAMNT_0025936421 /DNA_START=141 /DNA_END=1511 /DNA_ORIENTATION=+